jgi:transcriptional regulator with XRE-family HTH domain
MKTSSTRGPTEVDKHVGARLRLRRSVIDMSQSDLGKELGVTFQQVQKYERGTNRVGASRLFNLANVLGVPIEYFFEGLKKTGTVQIAGDADALYDFIASPDGLALASAFSAVEDPIVRRRLIDLIRSMDSTGQALQLLQVAA